MRFDGPVLHILMLAVVTYLVTPAPLIAQDDFSGSDTGSGSRHSSGETVFVHTDRTFYLSGEIIWFQVYCFSNATKRLSYMSKVAYLEVLDAKRNAILQTMVELKDGLGSGSLALPFSIRSGHFVLRAYTKWMENFPPGYFFHKTLTIVNPMLRPDMEGVADSLKYDIQFFPEGGDLVADLESVIAFRGINQYGHGVDFSGRVVDEAGDAVATFTAGDFGLGKFVFTPRQGRRYRALVHTNSGRDLTFPFPRALSSGYVMHLVDGGDSLRVIVNYGPVSDHHDSITLLIRKNERAVAQLTSVLNANRAIFLIGNSVVPDGISQLTLIGPGNVPACERLYFKKPVSRLTVTPDLKERYDQRGIVQLRLRTTSSAGAMEPAALSVSVFRLDSLQSSEADNLWAYVWLSAELPGTIESLSSYGTETPPEEFDLLMLTHGWRRIAQPGESARRKANDGLVPELRYPLVEATITNKAGEPAAGIPVFLTVPGRYFRLQQSVSDAEGNLLFEVEDLFGPHQLILTTANADSLFNFSLRSPYANAVADFKPAPLSLKPNVKESLLARSIHMQAMNSYWTGELDRMIQQAMDSSLFYGRPDERYFLDDYTRFPVMEEVLREYVKGVFVRRQKGKFVLYALDVLRNQVYEGPMLLLDGVPLFGADKIMALDPLQVRQVDVVERVCYEGRIAASGLIAFFSYKGDLGGMELNSSYLVTDYDGLAINREFYSPRYDLMEHEDRVPDFRNTLFWDPALRTDASGLGEADFYTGDLPGTYAVVVQGVGRDGSVGTSVGTFEVKPAR